MFEQILNLLYPRYCSICHKHGDYLCDRCRKSFKKNLPECYICRRLSPGYITHFTCKKASSLDRVFVAWEYNIDSSKVLKLYKYKNVKNIEQQLSTLLIEELLNRGFSRDLGQTLLVPVTISKARLKERGFNQSELIAKNIAQKLNKDICLDLIATINTKEHRAGQNLTQRYSNQRNPFCMNNYTDISKYTSITIVDDVITTGITLENISTILRAIYGKNLNINAICLFRGKPNYSYPADSLFNSSTMV